MNKAERDRIRLAKHAWEDSRARVRMTQEALERASRDVDDAHYDFEQWEGKERFLKIEKLLEEAQADERKTQKELRASLEAAGLL